MTKTMSPKMEAALISITLALVTAPATELAEAGELAEADLEALKGVGLPQIHALAKRGLLVRRAGKRALTATGEMVGHSYYSVA